MPSLSSAVSFNTMEKPVESEIQQVRAELMSFVYTVSHDLNAPLRAVVNFSRMLSEKYSDVLDERGQHYLAFIEDGGQKAQAMLNGLLQFSRLNTQSQEPVLVDCDSLIKSCVTMLHEDIEKQQATIEFSSLPIVMADADQLLQLFLALISNAIKFHAPNQPPKVSIFAETGDSGHYFRVQDDGIGIDVAYHSRIFELFKRLHTDREYEGIGMGLTLAQKIVDRHLGKIWVEPVLPRGTAFCFTLPFRGPLSAESTF